MRLFLVTLLISVNVLAGFPPTTSKLEGETNPSTTFNYEFPYFTGTRTGITTSLGTLSMLGGGTGNNVLMPISHIPFSDGTKLISDVDLIFDNVGDGFHGKQLTGNLSMNITSNTITDSNYGYAVDFGQRLNNMLTINSGTPISETDYFQTGLVGTFSFNDNYSKMSLTQLGVVANGTYATVEGATGKTADKTSGKTVMMLIGAGASGGTVTDMSAYDAQGILDLSGGGTTSITNYYAYKSMEPYGYTFNNHWGLHLEGAGSENYLETSLAIGTTTHKVANSSVGLEIGGTTKAMKMPVLTTAQKNALTPLAGMEVYDSTLGKISVYNGSAWTVDAASLTTLTAGSITFADASGNLAQDNANLNWDAANNRLMVGTGTNSFTVNGSSKGSQLSVSSQGGSNAYEVAFHKHSNTLNPVLSMIRSQGSEASPSIVANTNVLGELNFLGYDGTDYEYGAKIESTVDGTPGNNDMPAALNFYTVPDGSVTPALALKIGQDKVAAFAGSAVIGGTTPAASTILDLQSTTGALKLPSMTSTQRNALTAANGMMILNTTSAQVECYTGSAWRECTKDIQGTAHALTAGGTISSSVLVFTQTYTVQSTAASGPITLSTTPFGTVAHVGGAKITLIGNSDTDTVTIPTNDAAKGVLGYAVTLTRGKTATYIYNATLDRFILTATATRVDMAAGVTGVLPIANGGTNNGSLGVTAGGVLYTDGSKVMNMGAGTSGQVVVSNGASAPTWGTVLTNPMTTGGDIIYGGASGVPTRLANGTSGDYLKSNGSTSAPSWGTFTTPTITRLTSNTGTYTTPANVKYIKVKMVGGGGGGGGSATTAAANAGSGGGGGASTFGSSLLTANGGSGGSQNAAQTSGGSVTVNSPANGSIFLTGGQGGGATANTVLTAGYGKGGDGGVSFFGGAGTGFGGTNNGTGGDAITNSGSGGGGGGSGNTLYSAGTAYTGSGGGAGGYIEAIINSPSATYSYAVGAGGSAGSAGTSGQAGGAGGSGIIIVEEYYQ